MLRALLGVALVAGLLTGSRSTAADETYAIKLYKSKKGDKIEHEKTESGTTTVTLTIAGTDNKQDIKSSKKEVYVEETLERKEGAPKATKLTRTYSAAEKTEGDKTTKHVYAGQTLLIEKKGEKYTFTIKGEPLDADDAKELDRSFNPKGYDPQTEDFLPDGPVKVGAGWTVPTAKSEKVFKSLGEEQMKLDAKKSSITGKLLKAYKKDGVQYGVLEFTFTVVITEIDVGGEFVKAKDGSKMVIKGTSDTCIDGTLEFEDSNLEVSLDITAEVPNGSLTLSSKSTGRETARPAKK